MRIKLIEVIVVLIEAGETKFSIVRAVGVHISTVKKALKAYKEHGTMDYCPSGGNIVFNERSSLANHLKAKINFNPNISINQLTRDFNMNR